MNAFGVIPTPQERQRRQPLDWAALFTEEQIGWVASVVTIYAGHLCGGWHIPGSTLVCACREPLFRLEAVTR